MLRHRPRVLLTGFGPFPGVPANATEQLVPSLAEAARRRFPDRRIDADVLPTKWQEAPERLAELLDGQEPVLTLHFGVSRRATGFAIEMRAHNRCSGSGDAAGEKRSLDCLTAGGVQVLASGVPVGRIVQRLRQRGLPAYLSRDAGSYLCNAILYRSLELGRLRASARRTGFVHLPAGLVPGCRPHGGCPLDWEGAIDGGLEIIAACLGSPSRVRRCRQG